MPASQHAAPHNECKIWCSNNILYSADKLAKAPIMSRNVKRCQGCLLNPLIELSLWLWCLLLWTSAMRSTGCCLWTKTLEFQVADVLAPTGVVKMLWSRNLYWQIETQNVTINSSRNRMLHVITSFRLHAHLVWLTFKPKTCLYTKDNSHLQTNMSDPLKWLTC